MFLNKLTDILKERTLRQFRLVILTRYLGNLIQKVQYFMRQIHNLPPIHLEYLPQLNGASYQQIPIIEFETGVYLLFSELQLELYEVVLAEELQ